MCWPQSNKFDTLEEWHSENEYVFAEDIVLSQSSALMLYLRAERLRAERLSITLLSSFPMEAYDLDQEEYDMNIVAQDWSSMREDEIVEHIALAAQEGSDVMYIPLRAERIEDRIWDAIDQAYERGLVCYDAEGVKL